jgi:hypothetical protein
MQFDSRTQAEIEAERDALRTPEERLKIAARDEGRGGEAARDGIIVDG